MTMWIIISHRAQRLAKLQMNFVTAVSHDLRTPITIISSAADNIALGVVHERQQVAQYGTVIGSQARRLSALVEQVLLFASVRDSSHRYVLRPIEVSEMIDTTLAASAELIQAARVSVERDIEPNLPPVMGDPFGLSQCLQNLITNALKYGGEPAWLGVRAVLAKNGNGPEIQVSISDRGIGIAAVGSAPHLQAVLPQPIGRRHADSRHRSRPGGGQRRRRSDERSSDRDQRARRRQHVHPAPAVREGNNAPANQGDGPAAVRLKVAEPSEMNSLIPSFGIVMRVAGSQSGDSALNS